MNSANSAPIKEKLIRIIAEVLQCDPSQITETTRLGSIASWDSLANINLIVAVEEAFQIEATPKMLVDMTSIEGILAVIEDLYTK